jgi:hypothetical protein
MASYYTGINPVFDESSDPVTAVYTVQKFPLMQVRERDGKRYRFVKFDNGTGNVAAVAGNVAYWTATAGTVCSDESDWSVPAGVFQGVIADAGYGWIQVYGPALLNTSGDDDITVGGILYATTTDGKVEMVDATIFTTTAATLAQIQRLLRRVGYAVAVDTDADNTVASFLTLA